MKKVLVITQYFYPENFRINDICKELVKREYDVTVLTGIPNYPLGDIYEGYKKEYKEEEWEGIHVVRLPIHPRGHNIITLGLNCLSFVNLGKSWINKTARLNNDKFPFDTIFTFEVSPMTQALIGAYASKKFGIKSILYVQDLWPENVIEIMGIKNPLIIKPIEKMVEKIYRDTDIILATSNSFVHDIQKRIKDKNTIGKVKYWPQYAEDFYIPLGKHIEGYNGQLDDGMFRICFTGNIGKTQGLEILAEVAKLIKYDYCKENKRVDIKFIIVGDGRNKSNFVNLLEKYDIIEMFDFFGKKEPEDIPEILGCCDVAFLSFTDNMLFSMTIPAKLQSYMACGMPVLASSCGETSNIINSYNFGLVSNVGNVLDLKRNIYWLKDNKNNLQIYSINSRKGYCENFNKETLMDEFECYINS